ncbi:MAG: hypothetical protein M3040_02435 [Bacteroidota bacterium]|nr:hypothetical protein [Bacteroidota bacterium]
MKNNRSIQLKAAFMLAVFALNTIVAFACSLGLEMGFNNTHHHHENNRQASANHSHSNAGHHHSAGLAVHHHQKGSPEKDDCCTPNAIKFQQADKNLNHSPGPVIKTPVFVVFLAAFLGLGVQHDHLYSVHCSLTPQYYPPPDIRIAIQSFQI